MTTSSPVTETTEPPRRPSRPRTPPAIALARNTWRGLTSMRTALILLFLLAIAAIPGALLPQRSLNAQAVAQYQTEHPLVGRWLDRLGFFEVFGSVWFASIYVLLFVSLIGCLIPRCWEYAKQLRARPVLTPRNLSRLPHHARLESTLDPSEAADRTESLLTGWRRLRRVEDSGAVTISAERGYLRETGNLVFHLSLVGLLVFFAIGRLFGYEGQVIVMADGRAQFCNSALLNYDFFRPGLRVDGTELTPFCLRVNDFEARFLPNAQPDGFSAKLSYQGERELGAGVWRDFDLQVNQPLRVDGDRVYLLGHGYAPRFVVTFPDGQVRIGQVQWRSTDPSTLLSEGAVKLDTPGVTDPELRRKTQLAIVGLFAPTAVFHDKLLTSGFPALRAPAVAIDVLRGDLGTESGRSQSIFEIDQSLVESGRLTKIARKNLEPGQELTLDDGTRIRFDGVAQWVSLQVSHDPGQRGVLLFAVLIILGLGCSLIIKRRRFWLRATPIDDEDGRRRTVIEIGGLARTDQAGYGEEFTRSVARIREAVGGKDS